MASLRTECDVVDCIRCSRPLPEGALFCPWCGKRQTAVAPPPQRKRRRRPKGSGTVYLKKDHLRANPWVAKTGRGEIAAATPVPPRPRLRWTIITPDTPAPPGYAIPLLMFTQSGRMSTFRMSAPKGSTATSKPTPKLRLCMIERCASSRPRTTSRSSPLWPKTVFPAAAVKAAAAVQPAVQVGHAERYHFHQLRRGSAFALCLSQKERTLTRAEIQRIQTVADDPAPANRLRLTAQIALVLVYTGMRIDELLSMRRDDVHLDQGLSCRRRKDRSWPPAHHPHPRPDPAHFGRVDAGQHRQRLPAPHFRRA